ncbi:hypothetical protein BEWA_053670 [Theileria equi strain WA]|uniref:DNA polymerase delta subunit 3 n=1 Tax=Theileria equi strain WA TaxID=1537102 RepID=L1LD15_THEEQ|nr:hypothetical protein BEWA_053670 [Theileria equi strain WA]EKX73312.1 hypothetical protein BEWA_053670 [Theileria equi strain WA]|eukprot:XP_004832764.1 hypothetical protein BEWA_053670 [Theileria equi strain WA]
MESFVKNNSEYVTLYTVNYGIEGEGTKISHVTHDTLQDLLSKHSNVKSDVYAIKPKDMDIKTCARSLWEKNIKFASENLSKASENNSLFIPNFANLRISNIRMRTFANITSAKPEPAAKKQVKPEVKKEEPIAKKELTKEESTISMDIDKSPQKIKPKEKEPEKTKAKKSEKTKSKTTSIKASFEEVKKTKGANLESSKIKIQKTEPEAELFDSDVPEEPVEVKKPVEPQSVTFVEKVSKESTYVENGYFVVEESDDYVQVVKTPAKPEKAPAERSPATVKEPEKKTAKPRSTKMNQSNIMSFFRK